VSGRPEGRELAYQASIFGSILPATWSFMLAARARGLGTCWTTLHLLAEEEAAHMLGIPFASVAQVALIPVAYYTGSEFGMAERDPIEPRVHWQRW